MPIHSTYQDKVVFKGVRKALAPLNLFPPSFIKGRGLGGWISLLQKYFPLSFEGEGD
jgi:hypothetical protein